jgi:hypothetical protein
MLRYIPNWVLWAIVLAAAAASPFIAMLSLILVGELLWNVADTIGLQATLGLSAALVIVLVLLKSRPSRPELEAG